MPFPSNSLQKRSFFGLLPTGFSLFPRLQLTTDKFGARYTPHLRTRADFSPNTQSLICKVLARPHKNDSYLLSVILMRREHFVFSPPPPTHSCHSFGSCTVLVTTAPSVLAASTGGSVKIVCNARTVTSRFSFPTYIPKRSAAQWHNGGKVHLK